MSEDLFRDEVLAIVPVDYLASYEATVVQQDSSDLTLEVICDDERIGHLSKVPLYVGIPGARVQVLPESRVIIQYSGGNPERYYATGMDMDLGGSKGIARVGDSVDLGYLAGTAPPGGGPVTFVLSPVEIPNSVHLTGKITSGHPRIKVSSVGQ